MTGLSKIRAIQIEVRSLDKKLRLAVAEARKDGATWREIGVEIGVTAEAVRRRYRTSKSNRNRSQCS